LFINLDSAKEGGINATYNCSDKQFNDFIDKVWFNLKDTKNITLSQQDLNEAVDKIIKI
jgi:hypothetical protein